APQDTNYKAAQQSQRRKCGRFHIRWFNRLYYNDIVFIYFAIKSTAVISLEYHRRIDNFSKFGPPQLPVNAYEIITQPDPQECVNNFLSPLRVTPPQDEEPSSLLHPGSDACN